MTPDEKKALEVLTTAIMDAIRDVASELGSGPDLGKIVASSLVGVIKALDDAAPGFKTSVMKRLEEKAN